MRGEVQEYFRAARGPRCASVSDGYGSSISNVGFCRSVLSTTGICQTCSAEPTHSAGTPLLLQAMFFNLVCACVCVCVCVCGHVCVSASKREKKRENMLVCLCATVSDYFASFAFTLKKNGSDPMCV